MVYIRLQATSVFILIFCINFIHTRTLTFHVHHEDSVHPCLSYLGLHPVAFIHRESIQYEWSLPVDGELQTSADARLSIFYYRGAQLKNLSVRLPHGAFNLKKQCGCMVIARYRGRIIMMYLWSVWICYSPYSQTWRDCEYSIHYLHRCATSQNYSTCM